MHLVLFFLFAQDPQSQAERVRSQMEKSLEQQRESVKQQAKTAGANLPPWTSPPLPPPLPPPPASADCDPVPAPALSEMIEEASADNGVDSGLVKEVARQESGFKPCAVSQKGAEGLMQLMPATQDQFDVTDPFDARQNLGAGAKLLRQLLDRYGGDVTKALGAYNAGAGRVDKAGGVPPIPETQNYVYSILSRLFGM